MLLDQANNRSNDTALPYTLNEKEKKCLLANQLHATCNDSWPRSPSSWLLESVKHVAHTTSSSIDMWAEGTLNHLMSRVHQEEAYKHTEHNTIMSSIKPIFLEKGRGEKKREKGIKNLSLLSVTRVQCKAMNHWRCSAYHPRENLLCTPPQQLSYSKLSKLSSLSSHCLRGKMKQLKQYSREVTKQKAVKRDRVNVAGISSPCQF